MAAGRRLGPSSGRCEKCGGRYSINPLRPHACHAEPVELAPLDRAEVTEFLNSSVMGFMEGVLTHLKESVEKRFVTRFGVKPDSVAVLRDDLSNPDRVLLSIHVEVNGEHYESVHRNGLYSYDDAEDY